MKSLSIYFEGGGDKSAQRATLRQGMNAFLSSLKDQACAKRWQWKLVPCGGRSQTFAAFQNARNQASESEIVILLVDAEAPITASTRVEHLRLRIGDGWDLTGVPEDHIHLMAQAMEAWIVADPEALAKYYGQGFQRNALPKRANLEEEPKTDCADKLAKATEKTQKGEYHKIKHAGDLLGRISEQKVRAYCPHAEILFTKVCGLIETH
ncbi:DUF4276 family protein [uncultured Gammaproteobacteria bacterium]